MKGDSSSSVESSESISSEETGTNLGASQSVLTEAETQADPLDPLLLPSAELRPSSATFDPSALPDAEDPQTSTFHVLPEDPCQSAPGVDAPQSECNPEALQDSLNAATSTPGTKETSTFQGVPQDATPPMSLQALTPAHLSFSTDKPLTIPIAATGTPVCFTVQLTTPEPEPPRGDSI